AGTALALGLIACSTAAPGEEQRKRKRRRSAVHGRSPPGCEGGGSIRPFRHSHALARPSISGGGVDAGARNPVRACDVQPRPLFPMGRDVAKISRGSGGCFSVRGGFEISR